MERGNAMSAGKQQGRLSFAVLAFALGMIVVVVGGYLLLKAGRNAAPAAPSQDALMRSSRQIDMSQILLPNEWRVEADGKRFAFVLTRAGAISQGDENCTVSFDGCVSSENVEHPFLVQVDVEPVDSAEFYVSKISSFSVPQEKSIERTIAPFLRLYCSHLQKTLLKKK